MTEPLLLTFNAGSSSIKIGLFRVTPRGAESVGRGSLDLRHQPLTLRLPVPGDGDVRIDAPVTDDLHEVVDAVLAELAKHIDFGKVVGVGHRVVHGGLDFHGAILVDDKNLAAMDALTPLAPLHQPESLRVVRALRHLRPALAQTASFDTAFHATQQDLVRRYALPRELHEAGVRRYGFHGLSYRYIAGLLARREPRLAQPESRVVVAHLGSGASLCAMRGGLSVDTSMGFSTLDGVPMATRCGAIDAGVLLYLAGQRGMSTSDIESLLYHRSGLLGVSGISADMRVLEESAEPAAREALELFALRSAGEVARLTATLGGLDALVFTAGIGEHDAKARAAICARLEWLGIVLDESANERHAERIDSGESRIAVRVLATDEEQVIADEALPLLSH